MEPFLGQIQAFGFNFAPRGWTLCNGQILPINQYQSLFSLLGTIYGGDGRTSFGLPELRGRSMIQHGQGPGLSPFNIGNKGGAETVTLHTTNLPSHNHKVTATTNDATLDEPAANARFGTTGTPVYANTGSGTVQLASDSTTHTGGGQSFNIRDPYLAVSICIALQGLFPSRN
jgi:microcystin-dependent protein